MTLFETMFVRRAVRSYDMTPLDSDTLNEVQSYLSGIEQLDGQRARFEIVQGDKVGNKSAPHYITAYCDETAAAYINVGYMLEKMDLYLQSIGLGSLWLGTAKPKENKQDFCIMLAFGRTSVPLRTRIEDFNRLPLEEVSNSTNLTAKAMRLAPSAVNSQPWKFYFEEGLITIRYFGRGLMKLVLKNRMNKVDLGICTRFAVEALQSEGKQIPKIRLSTDSKHPEIEIQYQ